MARLVTPEAQPPPPGARGFVKSGPLAIDAPLTVTIPSFGEDHVFEVRRWEYRGATLPAPGDEVLVIFNDVQEPWVAAWWPAAGDEGGGGGGSEGSPILDARRFIGLTSSTSDKGPEAQLAIDRAHEYEMALWLPPWRVVTAQTLHYYDRSMILGNGPAVSGFKLADGSDVDLLTSQSFGVSSRVNFKLEGFGLDGNEAHNSAGRGLLVDGLTFTLRELFVYSTAETGIVGKKTTAAEGSASAYMDAWIEGVKSYLNVDGGWAWEGPHDAHFSNCHAISNHSYGFRWFGEGFAAKVYACHAYGDHDYPFQIEAGIKAVNCEAEGGAKAQVALWADNVHWLGGTAFHDATSEIDGKVGFQFGRTAGEGGELSAFNTQLLGVRVNDCTNGAFNFKNGWGGSRIQAYVYATSGKAFVGTAPNPGQLDCLVHLQGGVEMGIAHATDRRYADSATDDVIALWVHGDLHPHLIVSPSKISFSDGEAEPDVALERTGEGELTIPGRLIADEIETAIVQTITGNKGPAGAALNALLIGLNEVGIINNATSSPVIEKASAATIGLGETCPSVVKLTGTAEVTTINATNAGHVVYVIFTETAKLVAGSNLKLAATINGTPDDVVCLLCDGTNWYQVSPLSVNP